MTVTCLVASCEGVNWRKEEASARFGSVKDVSTPRHVYVGRCPAFCALTFGARLTALRSRD